MEKAEAASFLGVSVRTLERLTAAGRLTKGRARRKTKPVVVFDRNELELLKAELTGRPTMELSSVPKASNPSPSVGFRLDQFYWERLESEGKHRGLSVGEYARSLVIRCLEEGSGRQAVDEVVELRRGVARATYLFLASKADVSEEEAMRIAMEIAGPKENAA